MRVSIWKLVPSTFLIASILASAMFGCTEDETGACVTRDGANSYCFEDKSPAYCGDDQFSPGRTCSAVGYAYYCTVSEMREGGSSVIYGSGRYLNNARCNPAGGGSSSSSSSSSGSVSSGSSSGSTSSSSSGGISSSSGGPGEQCSTSSQTGCTITYCAGGPQGCYYTANGARFQCDCDDLTVCLQDVADYCASQE